RQMGRSRKHHHTPVFYLQQFAEPMFGKSIKVFECDKGAWDKAPRTPKGIGWAWDLYSSVNLHGKHVDDFERFLTDEVDTQTAPAMKKAARDPESLNSRERELVALFIGFAAARTRGLLETTEEQYFERLSNEESARLGVVSKMWSDALKRPIINRDVVVGGFL